MLEIQEAEIEDIALLLSKVLDECGFSEERVKERILSMDKSSKAKCLATQKILQRNDIFRICVGSLREGTGIYGHSDTDILQVYTSVQCIEDKNQIFDQSKTVFKLEGDNTPAGHYLLRLIHPSKKQHTSDDVSYAFEERKGEVYLSSDKFMEKNDDVFATREGWILQSTCYQNRRGPSIPKTYTQTDRRKECSISIPGLKLSTDFVRALPCDCPGIIKRWKERVRYHQWPSQSDIEIAASMPACVVPVGQKGSEVQHLQWRLCFTGTEIYLAKSFNNTQTKVYFLLKMIARHYLTGKPECEELTSYVMKNVMFWQAEGKSLEEFQPKYLIDRLADALEFLRDCVYKRQLQNYMVPERNLLHKVSNEERDFLLNKVENLLENLHTCVYLFLCQPCEIPASVAKMFELINVANRCERKIACIESLFSFNQLVEYHKKLFYPERFLCKFFQPYFLYLKLIFRYGYKVYPDPFSIQHEKLMDSFNKLRDILEENTWDVGTIYPHGQEDPSNTETTERNNNTESKDCELENSHSKDDKRLPTYQRHNKHLRKRFGKNKFESWKHKSKENLGNICSKMEIYIPDEFAATKSWKRIAFDLRILVLFCFLFLFIKFSKTSDELVEPVFKHYIIFLIPFAYLTYCVLTYWDNVTGYSFKRKLTERLKSTASKEFQSGNKELNVDYTLPGPFPLIVLFWFNSGWDLYEWELGYYTLFNTVS